MLVSMPIEIAGFPPFFLIQVTLRHGRSPTCNASNPIFPVNLHIKKLPFPESFGLLAHIVAYLR